MPIGSNYLLNILQNKISCILHMHLHIKRHVRFAQLQTLSQTVKWLDV